MTQDVSFHNLFVFELANNHMGDIDHGLNIIHKLHEASKDFGFNCAVKFQFRDLDTFIHPAYKGNFEFKYIKRFSETKLDDKSLKRMKNELQKLGFISMCTPFDETSVDKIVDFDFDVIKIASCSLTDWPLLEKIASTEKPIIASTAGASLKEIDRVVMFFEHRRKQLAIMHCVGEYPTCNENLNLNQIPFLIQRYPNITVGYSTHENPNNCNAIKMAIAAGAKIFERHVGLETDEYPLNAYSSSPEQISNWLTAAQQAFAMCGVSDTRREITKKERNDLQGLMRGVFAGRQILKGEKISPENTFFAIPNFDGQLVANNISKYQEYIASRDIEPNEGIFLKDVEHRDLREKVINIISKIRDMLIESKVHLPHKLQFELSHHYGIDRFDDWGATIINCINREYCKKLIIMLPGQKHPVHYHEAKEETFQNIAGDLILDLGEGEKLYHPGDIVVVNRGVKHSFRSEKGTVFEEVSSTHYIDDSFYDDEEIISNKNRKTEMTFWTDWLHEPIK